MKISIAASAVTTIFDYAKVKDLMAAGLYGINLMTYDFFGTPWAETLGHHTNRKALEEGGWAVETIVDHLLAEGFSADRINIGYAGYTRNARQVEIESLSPLKGSYNPVLALLPVPSNPAPANGMTSFIATGSGKPERP